MKQIFAYKIDLTKINGDGDFACPRCDTAISPDDDFEKAYSILKTKADTHGLGELIIRCNKCESRIHLSGFSLLQKLEKTKNKKEKISGKATANFSKRLNSRRAYRNSSRN